MNDPLETSSIVLRPRSDAPWWLLPILTFITGFAIAAALLVPLRNSPDYQRGHAEGYRQGMEDTMKDQNADMRMAYENGLRTGRSERMP